MKNALRFLFGICLMIGLTACSTRDTVKKDVYSGIYRSANQLQETQMLDDPPVVPQPPLSYDAYQRERLEIHSDKKGP